ncbi:MAG: ThiF family adenylyltransferase [Bifidobacteriaceae bacterium]|jgi:hypothetical protein|nr:ThiF family adenylyltransferase [Bifidobacteriaceae bacterium]
MISHSRPRDPDCQIIRWFKGGRIRPAQRVEGADFIPGQQGSVTTGRVTRLVPEQLSERMSLTMTRPVHEAIGRSIGRLRAETGAVLGGNRKLGLITHVHLDRSAAVTSVTYTPDVQVINRLLREEWDPQGIDFMGFVHSHPGAATSPSGGDRVYAERILAAVPKLDRMAMPIVRTVPDASEFLINGFVAVRSGTGRRNRRSRAGRHGDGVAVLDAPVIVLAPDHLHERPRPNPYLERVRSAYDPRVMTSTRVVAIGVGGSAGYLEKMARMGTGQFVLIDPDRVEPKNIGTQDADPLDIGIAKCDALARRLTRLNPNCHVWTVQAKDDAIDDIGFHRLLREPLPAGPAAIPALTLLGAFTDNFAAQDRVQRLGLHFGVPTLAANVYAEGRGVELAFAAPGLTEACIRCAQSSRYRAYLQDRYVNDVTSDGTPILATDRVNESKQVVTLALLHALNPLAQPDHPATIRYRGWMERLADRNLDLTRLDPDSPLPAFTRLDAVRDGSCVMDETLWTRPTPDGPGSPGGACPDCGGTGDLTDQIGTFAETRILTRVYGEARRASVAERVIRLAA